VSSILSMSCKQLGAPALWTWLVVGGCWVVACRVTAELWWSEYAVETTFQFVNPTPEQVARIEERLRLEAWRDGLLIGSIPYGLLGVILFRRQGCLVIPLAVAIVALSFIVHAASGLGRL
jgi:hypothetical protein